MRDTFFMRSSVVGNFLTLFKSDDISNHEYTYIKEVFIGAI